MNAMEQLGKMVNIFAKIAKRIVWHILAAVLCKVSRCHVELISNLICKLPPVLILQLTFYNLLRQFIFYIVFDSFSCLAREFPFGQIFLLLNLKINFNFNSLHQNEPINRTEKWPKVPMSLFSQVAQTNGKFV